MTSTRVVPGPLRWALRLLLFESAGTALLAAFLIYQGIRHDAASLSDAAALTGFVLLIGVALGGLAVALGRRKARARAPAIVLQLLAVMAAVVLTSAGLVWLALPLGLLALAVATLLLAPATSAALTE